MNLYRLLRNNKETGPHSQEEMIAMGFKPYDLIWVEGKSAGWRYPSEIPEFKEVAPAIEEQPYDRFFKKPAAGTAPKKEAETTTVTSTALTRETEKTTAREKTFQPPVYSTAARHIHVTLPSGNTVNVTTVNNTREPVQPKNIPQQAPVTEEKISFTKTIAQPYQPAIVEETIAPPVSAVKEKKVRREEQNKQYYPATASPANNFSWTTILGLFVGIATLVGLGIMIGLSMNKGNKDFAANESIHTKTKQVVTTPENENTNPANNPATQSDPAATNNLPQPEQPKQSLPDNSGLVKNAVIKKDFPVNNNDVVKEDKPLHPVNSNSLPETKSNNNTATEDRGTALKRNAIILPAVNIEKELNIKTNVYKVGAFGGISDLQCTLTNESKFALDVVEVEVMYIQANDKVYKTETIAFKDVAAGAQITLNAPKSTRGIKVTSKIVKVSAKESGLSKI